MGIICIPCSGVGRGKMAVRYLSLLKSAHLGWQSTKRYRSGLLRFCSVIQARIFENVFFLSVNFVETLCNMDGSAGCLKEWTINCAHLFICFCFLTGRRRGGLSVFEYRVLSWCRSYGS